MKAWPASFLIFSVAFPSSIFTFSVGAGKLTRTMQPSLPSAVQRLPPLSVDASSPSRLRALGDEFRFEFFESLGLFVDFAIERDSFGHQALEHVVGHGRAFSDPCFPRSPRRICSGGCAMRWLYTRFFQRPFPRLVVFLQRSSMSSGILPRPTKFFDRSWVSPAS